MWSSTSVVIAERGMPMGNTSIGTPAVPRRKLLRSGDRAAA
jgi:hypothetical protein